MVMLFHSPMSRMNRTLPEVVDGDSDPKTTSWRAHHGAMTRTKTATAPTAAANGIVGRRAPADRQARQRSNRKTTPREASTNSPSLRASVARPANRPARTKESPGRPDPRSARAAIQSDAITSGW